MNPILVRVVGWGCREFTALEFEALPRKAAARYLSLMPAVQMRVVLLEADSGEGPSVMGAMVGQLSSTINTPFRRGWTHFATSVN